MTRYVLIMLLFCNLSFSQDYFLGNRLYCETQNEESKRLFKIGVETLHLNTMLDKKYLNKTAEVFFEAYKIDKTFCDAIFFTGYTYRLLGNNELALGCYYIADSLAQNKSSEFKVNLAAEALKVKSTNGMKLARKKYNELIEYFPSNPEGYYGFALTSPEFGDYEKGLEYLNIAINKYAISYTNNDKADELNFLKGILLTLNKRYEEGLISLEKSSSTFKKDVNYQIYYSLCLLKVSEIKNDEKMKAKAKKIFDKIDAKWQIPKDVKDLLIF